MSSHGAGRRALAFVAVAVAVVVLSLATGCGSGEGRGSASAGWVLTDFGRDDGASAVAIQPDGRIVVAGGSGPQVRAPNGSDFALARYTLAGKLDPSFGVDGRVVTDFGPNSYAADVAIQADGKIVVAGGTWGFPFHSALARYTPDGHLDRSFGVRGKVSTRFGPANAVVIQDDGKIIAAGSSGGGECIYQKSFALARYRPDGTLDQSFGIKGTVTTDVGPCAYVDAVVTQGRGLIVAAGPSGSPSSLTVTRYYPDGILDRSFGAGGKVRTKFGQRFATAADVTVERTGKIVVAGTSGEFHADEFGTPRNFALARYKPDGNLDPAFGIGGRVVTSLGASDRAAAVAIGIDGNIVVAGTTILRENDELPADFALVRYRPSGSLDTTFGARGKVLTAFAANRANSASAVAIQEDGKIVVAGRSADGVLRHPGDFALARYNPDGTLDRSFGAGG